MTLIGEAKLFTVMLMFPESDGVPPGSVTRSNCSVLSELISTPMMYPSVAEGSKLSAPCGVKGPAALGG